MKLQILVPQYQEDDTVVRGLLDSIAMQRGVDFNEIGVIIMNDGSDVILSRKLIDSYPFRVQYWLSSHGGVSAARNACLALAEADYVMFCDADDVFYNACGLWMVFKEIANGGFDMLYSRFLEECRIPGEQTARYISHSEDQVFVHGKVYRRIFLEANGITWNSELTVHEDSYFNILCHTLSHDTKYVDVPFYMWCWRDTSISRSSPEYMLHTYPDLLKSNDALIDELLRRGMEERADYMIASAVLDTYYTLQSPMWTADASTMYRGILCECFRTFWNKWRDRLCNLSAADFMAISKASRNRHIAEGMGMEQMTLEQWLKSIDCVWA